MELLSFVNQRRFRRANNATPAMPSRPSEARSTTRLTTVRIDPPREGERVSAFVGGSIEDWTDAGSFDMRHLLFERLRDRKIK